MKFIFYNIVNVYNLKMFLRIKVWNWLENPHIYWSIRFRCCWYIQSELNVSDDESTGRWDIFERKFALDDQLKMNRYPSIKKLVKVSLYLSHNNADVERGFPVSRRILKDGKSSMSLRFLNERLSSKIISGCLKMMIHKSLLGILWKYFQMFAHK